MNRKPNSDCRRSPCWVDQNTTIRSLMRLFKQLFSIQIINHIIRWLAQNSIYIYFPKYYWPIQQICLKHIFHALQSKGVTDTKEYTTCLLWLGLIMFTKSMLTIIHYVAIGFGFFPFKLCIRNPNYVTELTNISTGYTVDTHCLAHGSSALQNYQIQT